MPSILKGERPLETNEKKKHWNLYYIFQHDQEQHPIPPPFLKQLHQILKELLTQQSEES